MNDHIQPAFIRNTARRLKLAWGLSCLTIATIAAEPHRTDINPALLYWQAFAMLPDLSEDDQKHFFELDWRNRPMDQHAGELTSRFDATFRLLRQAAESKVRCDWGIDLSPGPDTFLPHLAKAKRCSQAAVLRARWFIREGRPAAARDDLIAAFVLGRNVATDGVVISTLVQLAIEGIVTGDIVQQWPLIQPSMINELLLAFEKAPARSTVGASIKTERAMFYGWLVRKVQQIQSTSPSEDDALKTLTLLLDRIVAEPGQDRTGFGADVIDAAGNSTAGLLAYLRQAEPLYIELEKVMQLSYSRFEPAMAQLRDRVADHPNLIVREFMPALLNVRLKEFRAISRLAMLQAAYQHHLDPVAGLGRVPDPFGTGPFEMSRFTLDGVDRGFKLRSQLRMPEFPEVLIFAEKTGSAFYIDGPKAGMKVP